MDEFLVNLSSLSWWLGVVVVGILINIISPHLNNGLERILIKTSSSFRMRVMERSERRNKKIAELKADQHKQLMFAFKEQRLRIRSLDGAVGGLALAAFGFVLGVLSALLLLIDKSQTGLSITFIIISGLGILYGLSKLIISFNDTRKVVEIRNILNEVNPDIADSDIVDWL